MQALIVDGNLESLQPIGQYVMEATRMAGLEKQAAYKLRLAVDEIATNIITHGYDEAGRQGRLEIQATLDPKCLTITIEDSGLPYDPRLAPPPDLSLPLEERNIGGLGVFLTIHSVDDFRYELVGERNRNIFVMNR